LAVASPLITIAIAALQTADLLQPWLINRLPGDRELVLFEGEIPTWLVQHCHQHQIVVQAIHAGCLCCLGGPVLKTELIRAARKYKPLSVLIVAGSQAALPAVADALQTPLLETSFSVTALYWLASFEKADLFDANSRLSKRQLDNWEACTAYVLVNPSKSKVTIHSKVSESIDTTAIASWSSSVRFVRKEVLEILGKTQWPAGLVFVFRTQREWYRFEGPKTEHERSISSLKQSNWRIDSHLIFQGSRFRDKAVVDNQQTEIITKQINDLAIDLGGLPDSKNVSK
jgi:hypothetical protein